MRAKAKMDRREDYVRPRPPATTLPFCVRTLGHNRHNPRHSTLGTYHRDAMLTVNLAGKGVYRQGGTRQLITAGMVGMVTPDEARGILMADPADPYDHYYVRFGGDIALEMASRIRAAHDSPFFQWSSWETLVPVLRRMWEHCSQPGPSERLRPLDAMLAELLARLDNPVSTDEKDVLTAHGLRDYLENHIDEPMDLERMATHFKTSKGHLCRTAKSCLGATIVTVWRRIKIDWACILLRETDLTVAEISRRTGFASPFYFSAVFKREKGASPIVWREAK